MGLEEEPADPLHGATEAADLPAGLSPVSPSVQRSSQGSTTSSDLKKALGSAFDAMMPLLKGSEPEDEGNTRNGGERIDADDEAALKAKLKELREKKKGEKRLKGKGKGKGKGGEGAPNKKNKKEKTGSHLRLCSCRRRRRMRFERTSKRFGLSMKTCAIMQYVCTSKASKAEGRLPSSVRRPACA